MALLGGTANRVDLVEVFAISLQLADRRYCCALVPFCVVGVRVRTVDHNTIHQNEMLPISLVVLVGVVRKTDSACDLHALGLQEIATVVFDDSERPVDVFQRPRRIRCP